LGDEGRSLQVQNSRFPHVVAVLREGREGRVKGKKKVRRQDWLEVNNRVQKDKKTAWEGEDTGKKNLKKENKKNRRRSYGYGIDKAREHKSLPRKGIYRKGIAQGGVASGCLKVVPDVGAKETTEKKKDLPKKGEKPVKMGGD